ncbi:hypothetical protein G6F58_003120 [Rhizopus delemar]|nr:hypothetical protein G6F58_003120 [Rhizopus delemar]
MLSQTQQWVKMHRAVVKSPENILNFLPQGMVQSIDLGPSEASDDEPQKRTRKQTLIKRSESKRRIGPTVSQRHSPKRIKKDLNDV